MVLTKAQAEVLRLLKVEKLTVMEIASRRKTSRNNIYEIIRRIGKSETQTNQDLKQGGLRTPIYGCNVSHKIRLHAQQYAAKVYNRTDRFNRLVGRSFVMQDSKIHVYKNSVMVWSGRSFYGSTREEVDSNAWEYWQIFFKQLERRIGGCIFKPAGAVIKAVKVGHYAELDNEFAKKSYKDHQKIEIRGLSPDNRVWLLADNSFNLKELETVHPAAAGVDMGDVIAPFMTTLRGDPHILETHAAKIGYIEKHFIELVQIVGSLKASRDPGHFSPDPNDRPDYMG